MLVLRGFCKVKMVGGNFLMMMMMMMDELIYYGFLFVVFGG